MLETDLLEFGSTLAKQAVRKLIETLYSAVSDKTKKLLKALHNERRVGHLCGQLLKVRKVKTLGQLDKPVDLMTFYCPVHVYVGGDRKKVNSLDDLGNRTNYIIEGLAGQGKSVFLRYLCAIEVMKAARIPVFIELRKLKPNDGLVASVSRIFADWKLDLDDEVFSELATSGRLLLLLDGFDEVGETMRAALLEELDELASRYEDMQVVVSSRPDSGIASSPHFSVVRLSDLEGDEFVFIVDKLLEDAVVAEQLVRRVRGSAARIQELLVTPLLVTLLVIRYKSFQELPEQLGDFYDSLFQILIERHDGMKMGFKRRRNCQMNDFQYRQVFESLCFRLKRHKARPFDYATMHDCVSVALKERGKKDDAVGFLADIVKITCLILRDGEGYEFIHKSVHEYYVASYIRQKPEIVAKQIYRKLFCGELYRLFSQELRFLAEMDTYRFDKFGALSFLERLFSLKRSAMNGRIAEHHVRAVEKVLRACLLELKYDPESQRYSVRAFHVPRFGPLRLYRVGDYEEKIISKLWTRRLREEDIGALRQRRERDIVISRITLGEMTKIVSESALDEAVAIVSATLTGELFDIGRAALENIATVESDEAMWNL